MSAAAQQQALSTPAQLQPERPLDDYAVDAVVPKESGLRFGFLKVPAFPDTCSLGAASRLMLEWPEPLPACLRMPMVPLQLDGVQHILRLRSRLQISEQLFADVGADLSLNRKALYPRTALEYRARLCRLSPCAAGPPLR